ncbi:MAG: hypothetical protein FD177_1922 [Desulfovibrionaceae bacterium]|nr:MAG: hypothetical protein FD177_1922 [Desulfovibrionaceae bacterium]
MSCRMLLTTLLVTLLVTQAAQAQRVGGPCSYADFPGKIAIVAVEPVPRVGAGAPGLPYQPHRVVFTFTPTGAVNHVLYKPAKTYELTLAGGEAPGPAFLKKYGVRPGAQFKTELHLITAGTCSPIVFTFHGIDVHDRFELTPR